MSTYYGFAIVIIGTFYILEGYDPFEKYPLYFSGYVVGIEVLLRMTGSKLFWEFGKYAVIYFLLLGIIRINRKTHIYYPILSYFILLLPAVIFVPIDFFNLWRQHVAFNLSGPAALTICSIYFFNRKINYKILENILFYMILPIISMAVYNVLSMPDLSTYHFLPYSDIYTSGSYGPNQVSSIFGLGIVVIIMAQVLKINLTGYKISDLLLLIIIFGLGLITFSRGGILAAVISFTCAISYYLLREQKKMYIISISLGLLLVSVFTFNTIISITDGVILQRYGFGKSEYGERFVLDLTGRAEIYKIDLNIFFDHIFTGVGPGQASALRANYGYGKGVSAHTEYSRMLAEHGILGLFSLLILIVVSATHLSSLDPKNINFIKILFGLLALLSMGHSAMRLAMPSFLYGFLFSKYTE